MQTHALQPFPTECFHHMGVGTVVPVEQAERLEKLPRPARQLCGETANSGATGLLGDAQHLCALMLCRGGAGQQQGAAAGDDQPFATHRQATLDQRLQAASTGHAGQCPAGKRQQSFAGTGAENQALVADLTAALGIFHQQGFIRRAGDHTGADMATYVGAGLQLLAQASGGAGQVGLGAVAPDLPTGQRVVVQQHDACAAAGGGEGGGHASGAGADDQQVGGFVHGRVCTCMPSRHRVWQARRRRPSISTRHS
ncbi:hypothetical protein D3C84_485980 [compost metagenome]